MRSIGYIYTPALLFEPCLIGRKNLCTLIIIFFAAAPVVSHAQTQPLNASYEYAVKALCGKSEGTRLVPGRYMTSINLHNPGPDSLYYKYKVVSAESGGVGDPSRFLRGRPLTSDQASGIDCNNIRRLGNSTGWFDGFTIIQSTNPLDVVAVYTAGGEDGMVRTLEIKSIPSHAITGLCPDLIVSDIQRPEWDATNRRSVIRATIRNIGGVAAPSTIARVIDPSTPQPGGAPYNAIASTPPLLPGGSALVEFHLPYWVYNPDADLEVTADYKNQVRECREDNNMEEFSELG